MDITQSIIPTLSKARIPQTLSWPVGAEAISAALQGAAHSSDLKLHFYFWSDFRLRNCSFEFLRVEYRNGAIPVEEYPVSNLFKRPPQFQWEIVVQPVPRLLRNKINLYIVEEALPRVKDWLDEYGNLVQNGSSILAFFYEQTVEEFVARKVKRLGPLR
jgi:hypothetical protein